MNSLQWFLGYLILFLMALRPSLDALQGYSAPFGSFQINPAVADGLLVIGISLLWFACLSRSDTKRLFTEPLVLLFAGWLLLQIPWVIMTYVNFPEARLHGVRDWIRLSALLPVIMVGSHYSWHGRAQRVLQFVTASLIAPVCVGIYQIIFQQGAMVRGIHRIQGTFVHPNHFAFYLVSMIGVCFWRWRTDREWFRAGVVLLGLVLLTFTFSFTGALMLAVFTGVCLLILNSKMRLIVFMVLALTGVYFSARKWAEPYL